MDEHLGAERLGEVARGLEAPFRRCVGLEARVLEVLGPDAEQDHATHVLRQARAVAGELVVHRQAVVAERDGEAAVAPLELRLDHVDRR